MAKSNHINGNLVCLTGVLAGISTLVAAIYFVAMLASVRAANAAKKSADALALTERAFVLFDDRISPDPRDKSELTYWLSNSGHTPAYIKIVRAYVRLGETGSGGTPASARDPSVSYKTGPDIAVLGPQQPQSVFEPIGTTDYIDVTVEQQIRSKSRALWFWGFVAYVDAFGEEHFTEWCRYWRPDDSDDNDQGIWVFCDEPGRNIAT